MQRLTLVIATGLIAGCACATALAGGVYHWKDAKGVSHYGSAPPAKGAYKTLPITGADPKTPATAAPTENPACGIARQNVALLQGKSGVQIDSDGDGKPDKTLSDADRTNQMELAQATLRVNCAQAAPSDKPSPGR